MTIRGIVVDEHCPAPELKAEIVGALFPLGEVPVANGFAVNPFILREKQRSLTAVERTEDVVELAEVDLEVTSYRVAPFRRRALALETS